MLQPARNIYSLETYFQLEEENQEIKYEYHDGKIVAMAGGTLNHGFLSMNAGFAINGALKTSGKVCRVYGSDVRIAINSINRRYYPDVSVVCGPSKTNPKEPNSLLNPVVVVEVLSPSTESFDRSTKFWGYRQIESLQDYILVSSERIQVEVYSRAEGDSWHIQMASGLEERVEGPSLGIHLSLAEIYGDLRFTPSDSAIHIDS